MNSRAKLEYNAYLCGPTLNGKLHLGNFKTFYKSILHYRDQNRGLNKNIILNITDIGESVYERAGSAQNGPKLQGYINTEVRKFIILLTNLGLKPWQIKIVRTSNYIKQIGRTINLLSGIWQATEKELIRDETGVYPDPKSTVGYLWRSGPAFNNMYFLNYFNTNSSALLQNTKGPSLNRVPGIPGWHIECATIINEHVRGSNLIHYGGADLKNIHHHNETHILNAIRPDLKIEWHRTPVLIVEDKKEQKMSKSLGNTLNLQDHSKKDIKNYFKKFLDSCSEQTNTVVSIVKLEEDLKNQNRGKVLNLRKRKYKVLKRLLCSRIKQKKAGNFKNADLIREKLKPLYIIKDLKDRSVVYEA